VRLEDIKRHTRLASVLGFCLALAQPGTAQAPTGTSAPETNAGYVPAISGAVGYVQNVNGGVTSLEPQFNPVLLIPFGSHVQLESRTEFFGFFQRQPQPTGPYKGKIFKSVDYAQVNWLANTHLIATAGKYLLPFGLYNERLSAIWIRNLQDTPITYPIGTRTSAAGDGFMLRGAALQRDKYSIHYSAYFSALSNIHELEAARTAGGDASIFLPKPRLEAGVSYQRFLQPREINSVATYMSWQPPSVPLDIKAEGDYSYFGRGYWLETAYLFQQLPIPPVFRKTQVVGRMQQFFPLNGGGNGLPRVDTQRFDFGLNYYFRDDLRFISSYGRTFSSQRNANVWNFGFTYRFLYPLWPARKK